MTGADEYFRQRNAELAAQVAKISDEEGYALLIASVDAKDLHLNLRPDWPHWANMAYVSVSDAACLSLGISPEARLPQINLSDVRERARAINADATRVHLGIAALESAQRRIQQREAQAMSAIGAGRLSVRGASGIDQMLGLVPRPALVSLPSYRRWAESLPEPYSFPEGFPPPEPHPSRAVYLSTLPTAPATDGEPVESTMSPALPQADPTCVDAGYDQGLKDAMPSSPDDDEPDTKTRATYMRTIRALAALAGLIDQEGKVASGAAGKVARRLGQLNFTSPKERRIRDLLSEVASLEPDAD